MRCKHKQPRGRTIGIGVTNHVEQRSFSAPVCICPCGAWLPLGPSNDEPEAVRVEMRAASMYACHVADSKCICFRCPLAHADREREARDLADEMMSRAIATHATEGK